MSEDLGKNEWMGQDEAGLNKALGALMRGPIEDGDLYFETTVSGGAMLDGVVKRTSSDLRQGWGAERSWERKPDMPTQMCWKPRKFSGQPRQRMPLEVEERNP